MVTIYNIEYLQSSTKVEFSDGYVCKMHFDIVVKFKLAKNMQLNEQEYALILKENEKLLATNLAVKYVQSALKTQKQVKDYLQRKSVSEENITVVLDKLIEYNLINDKEYAKAFVRSNSGKYGQFKLSQNLFQKGVAKDIIDEALMEIDKVHETIYNIATKYLNKKDKNLQNFNKTYRFLLSRGFKYDEVSRVMENIRIEFQNKL